MDYKSFEKNEVLKTNVLQDKNVVFSDVFFQKLKKEKIGVILLTRYFSVGRFDFLFSPLTIDYTTPVKVYPDYLEVTVYFPYEKFQQMIKEDGVKISMIDGVKTIEAKAILLKDRLIKAVSFTPPF